MYIFGRSKTHQVAICVSIEKLIEYSKVITSDAEMINVIMFYFDWIMRNMCVPGHAE